MKRFALAVLIVLVFGFPAFAGRGGGHGSRSYHGGGHRSGSHRSSGHHSTGHNSTSHSSGPRVHVHGYARKNGTHVQPHTRSYSGSASSKHHSYSSGSHHSSRSSTATRPPKYGSSTHTSRSRSHTSTSTGHRDSHGHVKRSVEAKDTFKRQHPCPSTGRSAGACPGYVIDHVRPLCRGGADSPSNMQWQTVAAGKAKDKTECN